jgi:hypothetical protein
MAKRNWCIQWIWRLIYRTNLKYSGKRFDWKWEYQTGIRDYYYQTFRFSMFYKFGFRKLKKG